MEGGLLIALLIGALICGTVSAAVASDRGLSAPGFFWLGFFLGPIGIVAAVIAPRGPALDLAEQRALLEKRRDSGSITGGRYAEEIARLDNLPSTAAVARSASIADELAKWAKLRSDGSIDESEYIAIKAKLLGEAKAS